MIAAARVCGGGGAAGAAVVAVVCVVCVVCVVGAAMPARAALDVAWDCYLPSGNVRCEALESALFSSTAYARANEDAAAVAFNVRSQPSAGGVVYSVEVTGKDEGMHFTFKDAVPNGVAANAVLLRLTADLQKVSAPFLSVDAPAAAGDDVALVLRDPKLGPRNARKDDGQTGWYVEPAASFSAERAGIFDAKAHAGVDANWSSPAWRLLLSGWSSWLYVQADPSPGVKPAELVYQTFNIGTDVTVARTLYEGFSLAATANVEHVPPENYAFRADTYVGAEWVLVPWLKTDGGNIGAQYVVGAEHQQFVHAAAAGRTSFDYLRHRLLLFGTWHFAAVDVDGSVRIASIVNDVRYSSVAGAGAVTWRIVDDLSVSLGGELAYRNAMVEAPQDPESLHPLEQFYGGASFGDVVFSSSATLTYTFGNSLLARQDQRWKP